jgi:hypothetical protein
VHVLGLAACAFAHIPLDVLCDLWYCFIGTRFPLLVSAYWAFVFRGLPLVCRYGESSVFRPVLPRGKQSSELTPILPDSACIVYPICV